MAATRSLAALVLVALTARPAPGQPNPQLSYDVPQGFYRMASDAPVVLDAYDSHVSIRIYPFRGIREDPVQHFQRNLFVDFLPPAERETQLLAQPRPVDLRVPGAEHALGAQFIESFAGARRERMRIVIEKAAFVSLIDVLSDNGVVYQRLWPSISAFVASLSVTDTAPRRPTPAVPGGAGGGGFRPGLYTGTVRRFQPNLFGPPGSGQWMMDSRFYLFSNDGRVHRASDLPPAPGGDIRLFDFDAAARRDPENAGAYSVRGDQVTIRLGMNEAVTARFLPNGSIEINGTEFTFVSMR